MIIKQVGPLSCAKISGGLYAVLGLIAGCVLTLAALTGAFGAASSQAGGVGAMIGAGAIVVLPVLYGCLGFLAALVGAWLYNVLAGLVGGIELDIQ